jgi:hypothetical protein
MAYTRNEKETLEIDYALDKLWAAIPSVLKKLDWILQEKDDINHKATIKTKSGFMSYSTIIAIEAKTVAENKTHMTITAETPVTTITSMVDIGRTRDRIEHFIIELANKMEAPTKQTRNKPPKK